MNSATQKRYLTIAEAVQEGLYPNEGGLRWLVFNAKQNGLDKALRRIGRRVLIDELAFHAWMAEHSERRA